MDIDLFLERPSNLTGPKSDFEIKISRKVGCALNRKLMKLSLDTNIAIFFEIFRSF